MPQTNPGTSEDLLAELSAWVRLETPTTDPLAVNGLMDVAEGELARAGASITRIPGRDGFGDNLVACTPGEGRPVLIAGHLDTVWPHGMLDAMPLRVDGEQGTWETANEYAKAFVIGRLWKSRVKNGRRRVTIAALSSPEGEAQ